MRLLYLANIRLPTEKAHGLQIMQMCEAFVQAGADVTLAVANRLNSAQMNQIQDMWAYYGVAPCFDIRHIPCIDLLGLGIERYTFLLQSVSYTLALLVWCLLHRADVYYSREIPTLLALSLIKPRGALCYEAHQVATSRLGILMQKWCVQRVGLVVAVTGRLADDLKKHGGAQVIAAHDGYQASRFASAPPSPEARRQLGLPADGFIVGYVGRLHTMNVSKGIDEVIEAIGLLPAPQRQQIGLCLVGGPDEMAETLRARWLALDLPDENYLYQGHVAPSRVPVYLAAFDVCVMTLPDTDHFRYYASPLKLFEYMASGKAIITSDHPAVAEVLRNGESALLVPFGNRQALADALARLQNDPTLRSELGAAARRVSANYSWQSRAERILQAFSEAR